MSSKILRTLLLFISPVIQASIMNRTIDDTFGDLVTGALPTYVPTNLWQNPDCGGCAIKPKLDNVFMQTYSALTYMEEKFPSMSIQLSFQGTAVYVYFILANFVNDGVTTETLCDFFLDGVNVSRFHHEPTSSTNYEFNALVFSKDSLANMNHTLLISTSGVNRHLFTSFDYANYTFSDDILVTSSTSSPATQQQSPTTAPSTPSGDSQSRPIGVIVGGVIGGVLILSILIFIFLCLRRQRYRSRLGGNLEGAFASRGLLPLPLPRGTPIEPHTSMTVTSDRSRRTLPPAYNNSAFSNDDETGSASIASMRQAEIEDQIRGLTREMQALAGVENDSKQGPLIHPSFSFRRSRRAGAYMTQVQQQMDAMRAQIEYLQAQLHSNWAYGIRDDPPPSYSVVVPGEQRQDLPIQFL